ncbi:hypothetical protein V5O48_001270 [Marasmius crinis-equi]|uniref:XPG-I domain-containing protein n=1 Tax=Marasmius crinis-equi TaxID=585013 RepID=A0ABR3FYS4_9AGAR
MGVAGLWAELAPCRTTTTHTALSLTKFNSPSRGFRVGIDASIWFFHADYGKEGENPELRTLFFRCAELTNHGFLPLFIFDGPKRPDFKRGKRINKSSNKLINGTKEILDAFGFEYRTAPGEAEAELAFLNRIGVIDGILSDDVDNFLFGARTVIRNHSSTHANAASKSAIEKAKVFIYNLPHPSLPDIEPADLIFIALCSGGDYDSTGLPSCGIKIALGLARAGFGKSLYKAATTMAKDSQQLQTFLTKWREALAHELATNSSGFLPTKKPSVASKIPHTFPTVDVLFSYVNPVTSETLGRLDFYDDLLIGHGRADGWLKKDPSLPRLAEKCEFYFEWGFMESIIKRFRTVIFHGVVLRILRRAILEEEVSGRRQSAVLDLSFIKEHFSSDTYPLEVSSAMLPPLANTIHSSRQHASTSETLEYRLEIEPAILVRLTASGVKGTRRPDVNEWAYLDEAPDNDPGNAPGGSQNKKGPPDPHDKLRVWVPADIMRKAVPTLVENFEEVERKKAEKKANKGKRAVTASPSKPKPKGKVKQSETVEAGPSDADREQPKSKPVKGRTKTKLPLHSTPEDALSAPSACRANDALWDDGITDSEQVKARAIAEPQKVSRNESEPGPSTSTKPVVKDLTKGRSKSTTGTVVTAAPSKAKKSAAYGNGIDSFYNAHKPVASTVGAKAKGKAKAASFPSAKERHQVMWNQSDSDIEDDSSSLPDINELFGVCSKTLPSQPNSCPASKPALNMNHNDDPFYPVEPPDTPSPRKPTTATRRKKLSLSSDDGSVPSSAALQEAERLNKSPRKSREHTSPRKTSSAAGPIRTIADITHPSRSRRACSPTPDGRTAGSSGLTKNKASNKPVPVIILSSSSEGSSTETDEETKVPVKLKPVKKTSQTRPLEAARARIGLKGHDDATAILLAIHCGNINVLGISTTHGNTDSTFTAINAARCLLAFGGPTHVRVFPGASKPLLQPTKHDPEIHGPDGLGGVEGLPSVEDPAVLALIARDTDGKPIRALDGMSEHIRATWKGGSGSKTTVISSGPMTNVALFVAVYPDLLEAVEEFVFMGGGVGLGNRSAVAEFNILCDPHAAQIVLNANVPAVMIPINVTHTAIVTRKIHHQLLGHHGPLNDTDLPPAETNLRHTLSTLINFFADSYKSTFGFVDGPPLHDALTVAYVADPKLFKSRRYRVDIELAPSHTLGETVVDIWDYQKASDDAWGPGGKNCIVTESLDVEEFFKFFLECVSRCDLVSPLNK